MLVFAYIAEGKRDVFKSGLRGVGVVRQASAVNSIRAWQMHREDSGHMRNQEEGGVEMAFVSSESRRGLGSRSASSRSSLTVANLVEVDESKGTGEAAEDNYPKFMEDSAEKRLNVGGIDEVVINPFRERTLSKLPSRGLKIGDEESMPSSTPSAADTAAEVASPASMRWRQAGAFAGIKVAEPFEL